MGKSHSQLMDLAKLMGILVENMDAVQWGRLHIKQLQWFLSPYQKQIASSSHPLIQVPFKVRNSPWWWMKSSNLFSSKQYLIDKEEHLVTDASLSGWGTTWRNIPIQGRWSKSEANLPINILEQSSLTCSAAFLSGTPGDPCLGSHGQRGNQGTPEQAGWVEIGGPAQGGSEAFQLSGETYLLNKGRAYKRGGQHPSRLAEPGIDGSRRSLKCDLFHWITIRLGMPVVDLFALGLNVQVPQFFTQYFHPQEEAMDALTSPWPSGLLYAFPPIPLLPKPRRKIKREWAKVILVAPRWLWRPWFSTLQQMSQTDLLHLPLDSDMLVQGLVWHPKSEKLTIWLLKEDI